MPVRYQIDKPNELIRTECIGDVTLEEVVNHFQVLTQDPLCPNHLDVLLDLTEQTSLPESDQLREVTAAIRRVQRWVRFGACAIVAPTDALYGMLRMFQVFTEDLFREAQVFRSIGDAEAWLTARRAGERKLNERSHTSRST
jgi:hypothetical protein